MDLTDQIYRLDSLLSTYVTFTRWEQVAVVPMKSHVRIEWLRDKAFENDAIFHKKVKNIKFKDLDNEIIEYEKKVRYEQKKRDAAQAKDGAQEKTSNLRRV